MANTINPNNYFIVLTETQTEIIKNTTHFYNKSRNLTGTVVDIDFENQILKIKYNHYTETKKFSQIGKTLFFTEEDSELSEKALLMNRFDSQTGEKIPSKYIGFISVK